MRILIPFLCLILMASCHNKNDLNRIAELEKENIQLQSRISKYDNIYDSLFYNFLDSIYQTDGFNTCEIVFDRFIITNKILQRRIQLNSEKYQAQLIFAIDESHHIDKFYYTLPSRINTKREDFIEIKNDNHFSFTPKDTGWYYWNGIADLGNKRTGEVRRYSISDSFYVYK
ncbi:MAG: hypothetical protein KAX69_02755 [Chitinophagales bacterium]|nr:hypothetical protein [Chitinophagales bacterium]